MDNKSDKIRKLDMDDLEVVTGGGVADFLNEARIGRMYDNTNGTANTNNPKDPKRNRMIVRQA